MCARSGRARSICSSISNQTRHLEIPSNGHAFDPENSIVRTERNELREFHCNFTYVESARDPFLWNFSFVPREEKKKKKNSRSSKANTTFPPANRIESNRMESRSKSRFSSSAVIQIPRRDLFESNSLQVSLDGCRIKSGTRSTAGQSREFASLERGRPASAGNF